MTPGVPFATIADIKSLFRNLSSDEETRAGELLPVVSDSLRQKAKSLGSDIDKMIVDGSILPNVIKAVTVNIIGRVLNASTTSEAAAQMSQGAGGYTQSVTYLVPGGGIRILNMDMESLGIRHKQKIGAFEIYGTHKGHADNSCNED